MSSGDKYTMKLLLCDRRPVAEFISGGSRAGKDIAVWVGTAGDKERGGKRKCQANQSHGDGRPVDITLEM